MNNREKYINELNRALNKYTKNGDEWLIDLHVMYLDGSFGSFENGSNPEEAQKTIKDIDNVLGKELNKEELKEFTLDTFRKMISIFVFEKTFLIDAEELDSILKENLKDKYDKFIDSLVNNLVDIKEEL